MLIHKKNKAPFFRSAIVFISFLFLSHGLFSQSSSQNHSPKFAGIASAILPGSGQVYNQKYWKVPLVYAGLSAAAYFIYYNGKVYSNFKNAYSARVDSVTGNELSSFQVWNITNNSTIYLDAYSNDQLSQIENIYRRYLDLAVIGATAVYALNIVDAVVDAHLFYFDVTDDISLQIIPQPISFSHLHSTAGVTLNLKF